MDYATIEWQSESSARKMFTGGGGGGISIVP